MKVKWHGVRKSEPSDFLPSPPIKNVVDEGVHDSIHEPKTAPITNCTFSPVQEEAGTGIQSGTDRESSIPITQESNRGVLQTDSEVFRQIFYIPKKTVQGTPIRPIIQVAHLYQGDTTSTLLDTKNGDHDISILGRPPDFRTVKGNIQAAHHRGPEQVQANLVPVQPVEIGNGAETNDKSHDNDNKLPKDVSQGAKIKDNPQQSRELHWKKSSYLCGSAARSSYSEATSRAQELLSQNKDFMEIEGPLEQLAVKKLQFWKDQLA
ncbi:hypothetical protein AYI69_g3321 [Smittium culicis]|uniref:Uncharacterized protein n=1 Tax=Smittium culicis TaxID=133412 RepID=A0A1R1YK17_9FUNG|nr:hypothetical protein AYI69_g3321 [Smittium culicis]